MADSITEGIDNPPTIPISVIIVAKNEERNLPRCLSALDFSDDIHVIDDYSTDDTAAIARRLNAQVHQHRMVNIADQRNWAQEAVSVKYDWILHLDSDEVVTPEMALEIHKRLPTARDDLAGFYVCYKTMFMDRWLRRSAQFPIWILRLVHRGKVEFIPRGHGERHRIHGRVDRIVEPFLHYNFSQGLTHWFERHNRYSTVEAERCLQEHRLQKLHWADLICSDSVRRRGFLRDLSARLPFRPWVKFAYMYLLRLGFLDGYPGLTYCVLQAVYEYMICLKMREFRRGGV